MLYVSQKMNKLGLNQIGWLRLLVGVSSAFGLLFSLIYGAGRGPSMIPTGYDQIANMRIAMYSVLLCGTLFFNRSIELSIITLSLGLMLRGYLELKTSLLKSWYIAGCDIRVEWLLMIPALYALNFILPALLLCESVRKYGKNSG